MTEKELEMMLSQKVPAAPRENVSIVLSPDITRNAMRLKKLRHDRLQTVLCLLAAISAECIPLMGALTAAAGGLTLLKEVKSL